MFILGYLLCVLYFSQGVHDVFFRFLGVSSIYSTISTLLRCCSSLGFLCLAVPLGFACLAVPLGFACLAVHYWDLFVLLINTEICLSCCTTGIVSLVVPLGFVCLAVPLIFFMK